MKPANEGTSREYAPVKRFAVAASNAQRLAACKARARLLTANWAVLVLAWDAIAAAERCKNPAIAAAWLTEAEEHLAQI